MKYPIFLILSGLMSIALQGNELKPFVSDGCTLFPDAMPLGDAQWLDCCIAHDRAYWAGGTEEERKSADRTLRECVAAIGEPEVADVMLAGVRAGGAPWLPTGFRWGYGWNENRGYAPLSESDKRMVLEKSDEADIALFDAQIERDAETVPRVRQSLRDVLEYMHAHPELFAPSREAPNRLRTREERMAIWQTWQSFLDRLMVIEAIERRYDNPPVYSGDESTVGTLQNAAFLAQYRYAMEFITIMERDRGMHTILNEAVPELGLEKGRYSALKFRFLNVIKGADFMRRQLRVRTARGVDRHPELTEGIEEDQKTIWEMGRGDGPKATVKNAVKIVADTAFTLSFPVQKGVSEWMGDVKVLRNGKSLITPAQIREIHRHLQPGDIILERREWYLSNIGLPGYWPHAALYVGTPEERRAFFGKDHPLEPLLKQTYPEAYTTSLLDENGHTRRIIEAMSEGVCFTSIEHSLAADSIAVLRPKLSKSDIAEAIRRAFHYSGRPYDFNFDFATDASLVCTELVYKAYEPRTGYQGLKLPLETIMGRSVTPANAIARLYDEERNTLQKQFDFILFYDGREWEHRAAKSDEKGFRESWKRPKWFIWVQSLPLKKGPDA